jgi:hypothetical protein
MINDAIAWRRQDVLAALTTLVVVMFGLAHGSFSALGPMFFLFGVVLFLYLPGALTLELFGVARPRSVALTLASGLPSGLATYYIGSSMLPARGYLVVTITCFVVVALRRPQWIVPASFRLSGPSVVTGLVVIFLSVGLLSATSYRSIEKRPDGGLGYTHSVDYENTKIGGSDAFFHAGVTAALARAPGHSLNPFLVGAPLAYHAGMDAVASAFDRELGVPPIDLAARLFPTLFVLTLCALVFQLAGALGLSASYSLLTVALTFASDGRLLFYLFPVNAEWETRHWLGYFSSYPASTYYWANPHLPALVVLMGGLIVLKTSGDNVRCRIFAGVLLGATVLFKVFLALHVAVVLSLLLAFRFVRSTSTARYDMMPVVAAAGVLMLGVVAGAGLYGDSEVSFALSYLGPVKGAFRLASLGPLAEIIEQARDEPGVLVSMQALASLALYFVILLGVRLIAAASTFRTMAQRPDEPVRWFVAVFFLVGLVPALVLAIRVSGLNNSFWFTNQSLFIAAVPIATSLSRVTRPGLRGVLVTLTLVVSLLPTWLDVRFRSLQPQALWSAAEVEAAAALEELASVDAVVLHPVNREAPSPASHLAGRATVLTYWQGYPFSFAPAEEVNRRASDVATFFKTEDPEVARTILSKYGATWVYAPETRPVRAPIAGILEEAYRNDQVTLYRFSFSR